MTLKREVRPGYYDPGKPFPVSNTIWGASAYWDTRPLLETPWLGHGWQRVPGCCRVVHEAIPEPLPFFAAAEHGWRGVPSANGKTYDYETGREMRSFTVVGVGPQPPSVPYGSLLRKDKPPK